MIVIGYISHQKKIKRTAVVTGTVTNALCNVISMGQESGFNCQLDVSYICEYKKNIVVK